MSSPFIDGGLPNGLPAASAVSLADIVIVCQGSTGTAGTGVTRAAMLSQIVAGAGGPFLPLTGGTMTGAVTGMTTLNGVTISGGTLAGANGNVYVTSEVGISDITGFENTFVGDRSGGGFTGSSNFNTVTGHNAAGIGGGVRFAGGSNAVYGTDAARNVKALNGSALFGANAIKAQTNAGGDQFTVFGFNAAANLNSSISPNLSAIFGQSAAIGAIGADFYRIAAFGSNTGGVLATAHNALILGTGVGNATFASGSGVILVGSGSQTVDTPAGGTSNYINFENIWKATGTNVPSTSVSTVAGLLTVTGNLTIASGITISGGTLAGANGNLFVTAESPQAGLTGSENAFFGDRTGAAFTGASSFNTAAGHNAAGLGGGVPFVGSNNSVFGADAARNVKALNASTIFGASALKAQTNAGGDQFTVFGANAALNLNGSVSPNLSALFGTSAGAGAVGADFYRIAAFGGNTGGVLSTANNALLLGTGVGNATFASGSGVILVGSGKVTVDTVAAGTSDYINIENIWTATGTGTPSTSVTTVAGLMTVTGALTASGGVLASSIDTAAAGALTVGPATATSLVIGNASVTTQILGTIKGAAGSFTANGSVATALSSVGPAGAHTTVQEWLMITDTGGTVRYIPCF